MKRKKNVIEIDTLLKFKICFSHIDGPGKLLSLSFVIDLLYRNIPFLAPPHRDARIQVVEFGGSQSYLLILLLHLVDEIISDAIQV